MRPIQTLILAIVAIPALLTAGTASATESQQGLGPSGPPLVAVAIGQLRENDGGSAAIDLRAGAREGHQRGNLRFFSPTEGYYNGAVRSLLVENGVIKATGGGGLIRPDGTRMLVRYTANISIDSKEVTITVRGRNGYSYTMAGHLDPGFVVAGNPREQSPRRAGRGLQRP